jgi:transglutaminase-like putative cysteine protease
MSGWSESSTRNSATTGLRNLVAMPLAGALAVICTSTALAGVVSGSAWLGYVIAATLVVAATGTVLRWLGVPRGLIWLVQLAALVCLTVLMFTSSGLFLIIPGTAAVHDLSTLLGQSINDIRDGIPPVTADRPMLCLITLCIGGVAIAVDTLVATARVPATSGLVLLCVYAVPASLAGKMLPWWSFVLGAAAYTLLLAVDGVRRHQEWRGRLGLPAAESTGAAPAAVGVTAVAAVIALVVGGTVTVIGTAGRLPGSTTATASTQLGIKPFTTLRGMLATTANTELFHVEGLPEDAPYLRALTLSHYQPNVGFISDGVMPAGVAANGLLPDPAGTTPNERTTNITIAPMAWNDVWLPVFGSPHQLTNVYYSYRYDVASGIVYSPLSQHPNQYVEQAVLDVPTAAALRSAGTGYGPQANAQYLQTGPVDPRVRALAARLTARATTPFDQALAIYSYFTTPSNGFLYSTQTGATASSDALVDFLFNNKTGYCEQYATAMAVLLRTLGIPTRVAIGFTDGSVSGSQRVITSRDAHAWDEVYFPGHGWVPFDPTPLSDGRGRVPAYLASAGNSPDAAATGLTGGQNPHNNSAQSTPPANQVATAKAAGGGPAPAPTSGWRWWTLLALLAIAVAVTVWAVRVRHRRWLAAVGLCWALVLFFAAALLSWWLAALVLLIELVLLPAALRETRRRQRARTVAAAGADAASAAWAELVAESWDRGRPIPETDTVRHAASRMIREHSLDDEGQHGLHTLVGAVELSWYGHREQEPDNGVLSEAFDNVRRSLRRNAPLALRARLAPRSVFQRPSSNRRRNLSSMR